MSDILELKDRTLVDLLLEEGRDVATPVSALATEARRGGESAYHGLIPLSAPQPGEQFAFEVDLDRCSGCKGCVTACHSLNGLDDAEAWRDVGLLVGGDQRQPFQQTVTSACHHCVEPACLQGCPVNAYEKDPVSGIVMHLDDQCIGCQYCVLKCPYDVPKYNPKRGIVRKCDMCHSRLSSGEAPACVQACPHEAIRIVSIDQRESRSAAARGNFLLGAPDPSYTTPTTRYRSARPLPVNVFAADEETLRPQPAHWPLVFMLTLTQVGVGGLILAARLGPSEPAIGSVLPLGWLMLHLGLAASVAHLGKPLKAWRVFLNLRSSWLSREAVALAFCAALSTAALCGWLYQNAGNPKPEWLWIRFLDATLLAGAAAGVIGALCSALIYVDTRRSFWRFSNTASRFLGTVALGYLGLGLLLEPESQHVKEYALGLALLGALKLALEWGSQRENRATAALVYRPLRRLWVARLWCAAVAFLAAPGLCLWRDGLAGPAILGLAALAGEVLERCLYFKGVNAPKMPGGVAS